MDFLLEITKESKHASQVVRHLHRIILEQLSLDPTTSWDNKGYIVNLEAEILVKNQKKSAEDTLTSTLTTVPKEDEKYLYDESKATIQTFDKIIEKIQSIRESKLKATEANKRPRILRVAEKLQLSEGETKILEHILMSAIFTHKGNIYLPQDALSIASSVDLTSQDLLHFLSGNRTHIKQNMFEYFDPDHPLTSSMILAPEVMMALAGMELTDERLLKIDNTKAVAQVIQEESPRDLNKSTTNITNDNSGKDKLTAEEEPDHDVDDDVIISPAVSEESVVPEEVSQNQNAERDQSPRSKIPDDVQESLDFHEFLKKEIEAEKHILPPAVKIEATEDGNEKLTPYTSDLDYLETECKALVSLFQISQMETQRRENKTYNYNYRGDEFQQEARLRELRAQARVNKKKCEKRLALTKESGQWLPRVERIAQIRGLDNFEKQLTLALIGTHISDELQTLGHRRGTTVGFLLRAFCSTFEEQIQARSYFYKNSKLIKEGIIKMGSGLGLDNDLMDSHVTIDRRMLEFTMGLDTEFSELVEGSHLYLPRVNMDQVVLPEDTKKLILSTVENFEGFKRARKRMGLDEAFSYGGGIVMLFFGASGTGKTMMANSIANHMQKKILLINFPSLGRMSAGENLKFIFREAKINDAILFFDECESIFESREKGHYDVNLLLTEIERHDGLIVMATNRAFDLDEAMHRRITLAIEFQKPDPLLREKIWRANIPKDLVLDPNVNLKDLAMQFELTGGFIKNAIISALSMAVGRDGEKSATIKQEDLEHGARLQLRGRLRMIDFNHRVVPTHGLESLVLAQEKVKVLKEIISFEKARQILFSQWGFDKMIGTDQATSCLFWGPPGTGKTMAAEAIAFSTGKPLKVINIGELISKWVGETSKNINAVFEEASAHDAVLVFDEADSLFGTRTAVSTSTDRYANADVGLLLYHMEHFRGVVILCTNMVTQIDQAFFRRMKFVIEFSVPDIADRTKLWQQAIPKECPVAKEVDFHRLASKFEFAGGNIKSSVVRAATRAALREDNRMITMADLEQAAKEEQEKQGKNSTSQLYT